MKKRKKKRFIRDRLIKSLVIFDIILIIMVLLVFIFRGGPYKVEKCIKMIIIETSFSDFALVCLLIPIFKKEFEKKDSKELVEAFISTEKYIEVIPINVTKRNYFMKHLVEVAKFYAITSENNDKVIVILVFNHENEERFFEEISKKRFTSFYKLKIF